ncbi:MAG: hypothetical protein ACKO6N_28270 [Myxococcota bacterium]
MKGLWHYLEQRHALVWPQLQRDLAPFGLELERHHELIVDADAQSVGILTRGEGLDFSRRVRAQLERLEPDPLVLAHFDAQCDWMAHTRMFVKLEWQAQHSWPRVSWYHRRRPSVASVLSFFASRLAPAALESISRLAQLLEKDSIHFVAGHQRPGQPLRYKVYFSQAVSSLRAHAVAHRLRQALEQGGYPSPELARWQLWHSHWQQQAHEATLFVSLELDELGPLPGLKLDYPHIRPADVVFWAPPERAQRWWVCAQELVQALERRRLSHLGLRLNRDQVAVRFYVEGVVAPS